MSKFRKNIIYIIFLCSAIYGVKFHFFTDDDSLKVETLTESTPSVQQNVVVNSEPSSEILKLPDNWGRDPFRNDVTIEGGSAEYSSNETTTAPELTGISYYKSEASYAIINNRILQAGETIDGWQVLSIYNDYVKVSSLESTKILALGEEF